MGGLGPRHSPRLLDVGFAPNGDKSSFMRPPRERKFGGAETTQSLFGEGWEGAAGE